LMEPALPRRRARSRRLGRLLAGGSCRLGWGCCRLA
jgi:hypothetical protein